MTANANAIRLFEALDTAETLDDTIAPFQAYLAAEGLPQMSADELLCEDLTEDQRHTIKQYLRFWDNAIC